MSSSSVWRKELFEGSAARAAQRAFAWYRDEFFALFSPRALAWLLDRGVRRLTLRVGASPVALRFASPDGKSFAEPISADELSASSIDEALARRGLRRGATRIVVEIPREAFFLRRFDIPAAARANLPRLLAVELERKTPLRAADVLHGHAASPVSSGDKIAVEHWILRRDLLARAIEGSGLSIDDVDAVEPQWPPDAPTRAPSMRVRPQAEASHWEGRAAIALAALGAALIVIGVVVTIWRLDAAAADLDARIAELSGRAAQVRKIADRAASESRLLAILHEERDKFPSFADLWEEISRVLPDGAFLTELRLSEGRDNERLVDLVGFADSAASLPALFDRSPQFVDARLTAPITPDPTEKKEGFSLQAKVRRAP